MTDSGTAADREEIARLVAGFFGAFRSGQDSPGRLDELRRILLPEALVVRTCGEEPVTYDVESFIAPRQALLASGGRLVDFSEWDTGGRTEVFGDIAHHFGGYAKAGVLDGVPFTGRGAKSLQFVRTGLGWRISAVAWDDERDASAPQPSGGVPATDGPPYMS